MCAICYRLTVENDELKALLDLEYREWMTRISAIFRERDNRIDELRRESLKRANPEAALNLWGRPVRLDALRKAVQSRLELRAEYARREPELLSEEALSTLRADLECFVENAVKGDQRSLPDAGDIIAELRVGVDKLALNRRAPRSVLPATNQETAPTVFISYSWDNEEHKKWVLDLATKLREGGIEVVLDQWHLELGARVPEFMERAVRDSDCVLVICTEAYRRRFDNRTGGAGYEGHIITGEIIREVGSNKFIPILRRGNWESAVPTALAGVRGVDLRQDSAAECQLLLSHLRGVKNIPPVGVPLDSVRGAVVVARGQPAQPDPLGDILWLSKDDLPLFQEKRGAYLVVWLGNETLDPLEHCSVTLTSLQQYSEKRHDFHRNPFTPVVLIGAHTINAGGRSNEAAALARCSDIHNKGLTISNSKTEFNTGGIWLADLIVEGGGQRRKETLFFKWTPGQEPEFTTDPRL